MPRSLLRSISAAGVGCLPNAIFSASFLSSLTAEIGASKTATFTRASSKYYFDDVDSVDVVTSGNPAIPATNWGTGAGQTEGVYLGGAIRNWLQYSEQPQTAPWQDEGAPSARINNVAAAPDGNGTGGLLASGVGGGDGMVQTTTGGTALAAASNLGHFSVWLKAATTPIDVDLTIEGDSGGTPETTTVRHTITTSWERYSVFKEFSASATGNMQVKVTLPGASTGTFLWGMQLTDSIDGTNGHWHRDFPEYVKTEAASATSNRDELSYDSSNVTLAARTAGSVSLWWNPDSDSADMRNVTNQYLFDLVGSGELSFAPYGGQTGSNNDRLYFSYNGTADTYDCSATYIERGVWGHWLVTWSFAGGTVDWVVYKNGVEIGSGSLGGVTVPAATNLVIGKRGDFHSNSAGKGVYSRFALYGCVLTAAQALIKYNAEKSNYGL